MIGLIDEPQKLCISRKEIGKRILDLHSKKIIDLSQVSSPLHLERIVDLLEQNNQNMEYASFEEMFDPEMLTRMITSRHYNWTRPRYAPKMPPFFELERKK